MNLLETFAAAIKTYEGWFAGSRSQRNHNPGNLKFANQSKAIGKDKDNFAIFTNDQDGQEALINQIQIAIDGRSKIYNPEMTITQFFEKYAPSADNNNPNKYAEFVANSIGKPSTFQIKNLKNENENNKKSVIKILINEEVIWEKEY